MEELNKQYQFACQKAILREKLLQEKYDYEEMSIIENMLTYLKNEYNGFGRYNDKESFEESIINDKTNTLYSEALDWFNICKKCLDINKEICAFKMKEK